MRVTPDQNAKADKIRAELDQAATRIRAATHYTADHAQGLLAEAYLVARDKMQNLRNADDAGHSNELKTLEGLLFSVQAIVGFTADPAARASAAIAYRDAQDRVDQIVADGENDQRQISDQLRLLLDRATRTSDEYMARAVLDAAVRLNDYDLINAFIDAHENRRAEFERDISRLLQLRNRPTSAVSLIATEMTYNLDKPAELQGMQDFNLRELAGRNALQGLAPITTGAGPAILGGF